MGVPGGFRSVPGVELTKTTSSLTICLSFFCTTNTKSPTATGLTSPYHVTRRVSVNRYSRNWISPQVSTRSIQRSSSIGDSWFRSPDLFNVFGFSLRLSRLKVTVAILSMKASHSTAPSRYFRASANSSWERYVDCDVVLECFFRLLLMNRCTYDPVRRSRFRLFQIPECSLRFYSNIFLVYKRLWNFPRMFYCVSCRCSFWESFKSCFWPSRGVHSMNVLGVPSGNPS